jgi:hypothetical protein
VVETAGEDFSLSPKSLQHLSPNFGVFRETCVAERPLRLAREEPAILPSLSLRRSSLELVHWANSFASRTTPHPPESRGDWGRQEAPTLLEEGVQFACCSKVEKAHFH